MVRTVLLLAIFLLTLGIAHSQNQSDLLFEGESALKVTPIVHGTLVLEWHDEVIYVDPYGGVQKFKGIAPPSLILITDIHGDHLNKETLFALDLTNAKILAPQAVYEELGELQNQTEILSNDEKAEFGEIIVSALPMYNLPNDETARHPKGRGNGYILSDGNKSIYVSGDTEDIPEMRNLKNIDLAFVCMNLPYTMSVEKAADAVIDFSPKIIYPFHYRGKGGLSDVDKFKILVNDTDKNINVRLRNWYQE